MSEYLEPINPLEHITKRDPIPESVMDSSAWFKTETVELNFGEYVGRPDENVVMHTSMLAYYFANGWYVDAVIKSWHDGKWESVAVTDTTQDSNANAKSSSTTHIESESEPKSYTSGTDQNGNAYSFSYGSTTKSDGETNSESKSSDNFNSGKGWSRVEQDGGPYWYSASKIRLKRRKMQSEAVLKDMIASFTKAYNEGREINNSRYDELVALYSIILSRTENEAGKLAEYGVGDFKPLADMVINECKKALEEYRQQASDIPADWMQSRVDEINRKFDAMVSAARTKAIDTGMYNDTVWTTTEAGIERNREIALNQLSDTMVTLKVDVYGKIAGMTADVGMKLLDCETRIIDAMQKSLIGPTEIRNTVFKWMLDFMERREDDYPGLEQLATVADRLGYGEGAVGGASA